jgi:hypothetical protein
MSNQKNNLVQKLMQHQSQLEPESKRDFVIMDSSKAKIGKSGDKNSPSN